MQLVHRIFNKDSPQKFIVNVPNPNGRILASGGKQFHVSTTCQVDDGVIVIVGRCMVVSICEYIHTNEQNIASFAVLIDHKSLQNKTTTKTLLELGNQAEKNLFEKKTQNILK